MKAIDIHLRENKVFRKISDEAIYCQACDKRVHIKATAVKHCIESHKKSKEHIRKFESWSASNSRQVAIANQIPIVDKKFNKELAKFVNGCNIPWTRINSKPFKNFLAFLGKHHVPDESYIRQQLPSLYEDSLIKIREYIGENWVYLQVDEARIADRAIVSVIIGRLNGEKSISHCLNVVEVTSQINHTCIFQIVNDSLNLLWPEQIHYEKFRLLLTDQASYMLKTGKNLKLLYPNLLHITCICHALHRVSEQIHSDYVDTKTFVEKFCKVLARAPRRQNHLSYLINAPVHSLPVVTRWGTWLSFVAFLHKYFDKIKEFLKEIEGEDNQAILLLNVLAQSQTIQQELIEINQLTNLVVIIKKLEERGLNIYEQKMLLNQAKEGLPQKYQEKLSDSLGKNPDFETIFNLESHQTATNYSFAPLCSVDVERSFSQLKNILTSRRHQFSQNNFKMYSVAQLYASNKE